MTTTGKPRRRHLYEFGGIFLLLLAAFIIWQTLLSPSVTVQPTVTVQVTP